MKSGIIHSVLLVQAPAGFHVYFWPRRSLNARLSMHAFAGRLPICQSQLCIASTLSATSGFRHFWPIIRQNGGRRTTLESSQQPSEWTFSGSHDTSICWRSTWRRRKELLKHSAYVWGSKRLTYRHGAVPAGPFNDGGVPWEDHWPQLVHRLHLHLLAVYEQLHLIGLHAQGQLVPLTIKYPLHATEGPHHLSGVRAGVEEVQRAGITVETQAHLLLSLGVTDLPQVPGLAGCVLSDFKRGDDGEVGGKSIWIHIAVGSEEMTERCLYFSRMPKASWFLKRWIILLTHATLLP